MTGTLLIQRLYKARFHCGIPNSFHQHVSISRIAKHHGLKVIIQTVSTTVTADCTHHGVSGSCVAV
ncbi:hypothetical protein C4J87_3250 [Pseudomonas sp. R1-43-08]|nr:hypothetical protein C4J87_3250 [Pseudomonas sp. R1-43-08]